MVVTTWGPNNGSPGLNPYSDKGVSRFWHLKKPLWNLTKNEKNKNNLWSYNFMEGMKIYGSFNADSYQEVSTTG